MLPHILKRKKTNINQSGLRFAADVTTFKRVVICDMAL